mgnify:CR=1 FL=1
MDTFEKQFEDMDVRSEYIEGAMNSSTTAAMPEDQVDELMQMVADEHGLKMSDVFKTATGATPGAVTRTSCSSSFSPSFLALSSPRHLAALPAGYGAGCLFHFCHLQFISAC